MITALYASVLAVLLVWLAIQVIKQRRVFVIGRIIHARGILKQSFKGRVKGMQLTFLIIAALVVLNLIYLPYGKLW